MQVGAITTYRGDNSTITAGLAGKITIIAGGKVTVGSLDTRNNRTKAGSLAGNVNITAYGDLTLTGASNTLQSSLGGTNNGDLVLTTSAGGGGKIYVGDETTDVLDLNQLHAVKFNSDSKTSYIGGVLTNFYTGNTGGSGSVADPYITTQKVLVAASDQNIYYKYTAGGLNDYLGGKVYKIATNSVGVAGTGGLLMVETGPGTKGTVIFFR